MTPLDDLARQPRARKLQPKVFKFLWNVYAKVWKLKNAPVDQYAWMMAIVMDHQRLQSPKRVDETHTQAAYDAIAPSLDELQKAQFHHGLEVMRAVRAGRKPPRAPEMPLLCPTCQVYAQRITKAAFLDLCPNAGPPPKNGDDRRWTYVCSNAPDCCAYVGTHEGDLYPLGTLADDKVGPVRGAVRRKLNFLFNEYGWNHGEQDAFIQKVLDLGPFSGQIQMLPKDKALALERIIEERQRTLLGYEGP